ncbi:MAG TPA: hypothetical protein VIX63_15880 [Vicinamibacterales bacterium]
MSHRLLLTTLISAGLTLLAGCGAASSPTAPSAPAVPAIITITSSGVSPKELTIAIGDRVTFVNDDVIQHDIAGGPDPAHPDCREIDAVGFLTRGQRRATAPFPVARTCEYHDHSVPLATMNGTIIIR